jgi:hippurate hydrolase
MNTPARRVAFALLVLVLLPPAGYAGEGRKAACRELEGGALAALAREVDRSLPAWSELYKECHQRPELSGQEKESAARIAGHFERAGLEVTTGVGGHGVVGVLKNGEGSTVLVRGDMDALPIVEETGLPFASRVRVTLPDGTTVGAMHACGHDLHQTVLVATAQTLAALRAHWSGTAILVAQPAEETGEGALAMIEAGLLRRFGRPDACIALHVSHEMKAGTVGWTPGWVNANVDSVDITLHGKGGHGAYPHASVDPVVASAQVVLALQTIVSRRINPLDHAVVTVGSIHGGTKHNVIPDEVRLQLTVRSFTDEVRRDVLESIRRIAVDTARAAGCPRPPDVVVRQGEFTPAAYNDPVLSEAAAGVFRRLLGEEAVIRRPPSMGGEDFGRFAKESGAAGFMFQLGVVAPERFEASQKPGGASLPPVHSSRFQVDIGPSLRTGVQCMAGLALSLFSGGGS